MDVSLGTTAVMNQLTICRLEFTSYGLLDFTHSKYQPGFHPLSRVDSSSCRSQLVNTPGLFVCTFVSLICSAAMSCSVVEATVPRSVDQHEVRPTTGFGLGSSSGMSCFARGKKAHSCLRVQISLVGVFHFGNTSSVPISRRALSPFRGTSGSWDISGK